MDKGEAHDAPEDNIQSSTKLILSDKAIIKTDNQSSQSSLGNQDSKKDEIRGRFLQALKRIPLRVKIACALILVLVLVFLFGVVLPLALDNDETQYLSESSLKQAVDIDDLSTVDYVYTGIAEKTGKFLWADTVDYRVRYEAHIRASFDMSAIRFEIDEEGKMVTAILPEAKIEPPIVNEDEFGFLPENAKADIAEVIGLCREDAANEFDERQIREEANRNLEDVVKALTLPLLDGWTLQCETSSYEVSEVGISDEAQ